MRGGTPGDPRPQEGARQVTDSFAPAPAWAWAWFADVPALAPACFPPAALKAHGGGMVGAQGWNCATPSLKAHPLHPRSPCSRTCSPSHRPFPHLCAGPRRSLKDTAHSAAPCRPPRPPLAQPPPARPPPSPSPLAGAARSPSSSSPPRSSCRGSGLRPPQPPSSILHFPSRLLTSPKSNPFAFAPHRPALPLPPPAQPGWRQTPPQAGGGGTSAPPTRPLPTGSAPPFLGGGGPQAMPHPLTSPWSLSSQPSRSGAQLTQRREGRGGRGEEDVGGSRVGTAPGRAGHGLP